MKEFAHPDQKEKVPANLNQALQTTLAIAKNEYKYVADVTTEFGDLPAVLCHVGDLNQVFLNLIVNAAHAIGDVVGKSGGKGTIRIKTAQEGNLARIDIADSGAGIPERIRQRIFEPFFTTKEVGKGTGQGLAIARSIVVTKHSGTLSFESEIGKGTTFTIRLPIGEASNLEGIG
jgi:signal transduction histidine kinase